MVSTSPGERLPHGLPERLESSLNFLLQYICCVAQLTALVHEAFRGSAYSLRPAPYFLGDHVALVEMRADAVGEVLTTVRAEIRVAAKV